jgi:hypothetical protein
LSFRRGTIGSVAVVCVGVFLFCVPQYWTNYWVRADAQRGMATIRSQSRWTSTLHLYYDYEVNQQLHHGSCPDYLLENYYSDVKPGAQVAVYYSVSHPWLSRLSKPTGVFEGGDILVWSVIGGVLLVIWIGRMILPSPLPAQSALRRSRAPSARRIRHPLPNWEADERVLESRDRVVESVERGDADDSEQERDSTPAPKRSKGGMVLYVLCAAVFVWVCVSNTRENFWLLTDAQRGKAFITGESGGKTFDYEYDVRGTRYRGTTPRSWLGKEGVGLRPGREAVVYYSATHPWLSSLTMPKNVMPPSTAIIDLFVIASFVWLWPRIFRPQPPP